jgi:hypothetical protein
MEIPKPRRNDMRSRLTKLGAALAALAALAVGGSALASASGSSSSPAKAPAAVVKQQVPPGADAEGTDSAADTDSIQDQSGADTAAESAAESPESGSETPGNDGPGGYADEPGNPNADTQQQGEH